MNDYILYKIIPTVIGFIVGVAILIGIRKWIKSERKDFKFKQSNEQ